jgi:RNA polymerase sigma-70 factor (ECF subfamily)
MEPNILKKHFIELYHKEADSIFRFCIIRVSDREVAIDITQDVFMSYWNYLLEGKKVISGRALLFAITRNSIIDWYRKKKNISLERIIKEDGLNFFKSEGEFLIDKASNKAETLAEVKLFIEKINKIDPIYREEVYLRFIEELTPKEIAIILEKPVTTVSVHVHRGLDQLRKLLDI